MKKEDVTEIVTYEKDLERSFEIEIKSVYCEVDDYSDDDDYDENYRYTMFGEVKKINGKKLREDMMVKGDAFNEHGRIIGSTKYFLEERDFLCFESFDLHFYTNTKAKKIRVYPSKNFS